MRSTRYLAGMWQSPVTWLVAGVALTALAVPALRRSMRPAMVGTMKGAYRMGNGFRESIMGRMMEIGEIVAEARDTVQRRTGQMTDAMQSTMNSAMEAGADAAAIMGEGMRAAGQVITNRAGSAGEEMADGAQEAGRAVANSARDSAETFNAKMENTRARHQKL